MTTLITGGAGYIGTHTCVELLTQGRPLVVLDDFSNSSAAALSRVEQISGKAFPFYEGDIRDRHLLERIFSEHDIKGVIHFAAYKAVGESAAKPLDYYDCNVCGLISVLQAAVRHQVETFVFSSSATVYGEPTSLPITENSPVQNATNPYGQTKVIGERVLQDLNQTGATLKIALLRYFNPVGAHPSGLIGEDPNDVPNNLMPYISQVAHGQLKQLTVHGNDYDTPDGTGVRDYIHVVDLARGHLNALEYLDSKPAGELLTVNLGTGKGVSVLEMIKAFEKASGKPVAYSIGPRRPGDVAACWADPRRAEQLLGWKATLTLDDMCTDSWRWQTSKASN